MSYSPSNRQGSGMYGHRGEGRWGSGCAGRGVLVHRLCRRGHPVTKLEIVCRDDDVSRLVDVIMKTAYSGRRGDGMIFVSDVNYAVKIRSGETGEASLIPKAKKRKP